MSSSSFTATLLCVFLGVTACSERPADSEYLYSLLPDVAGPGSAEPNLAAGPERSVIMSWLEPQDDGVALRYSVLRDDSWSAPSTVANGNDWFVNWADFPSVVAIDDSLWAAHWLVKAAAGVYEYDVAVSLSTNGGQTWREPITPHTDGTLSEHGFVSLYAMPGGVGALWLDGRETVGSSHEHGAPGGAGMTLRSTVIDTAGTLSNDQLADDLVCDCCQTDVAPGPLGPIAAYRDRSREEIRDIYVMRMIDGRWEAGRPVADDGWQIAGCPVNGPAIAAREDNVAVAWFTAADNAPRVRLALSADGAETFAAAVDIATDRPLGRVGVLLLGDGTAIASWLRQGAGSQGEVQARAVFSDGSLGNVVTVATTGAGRLSGFPQIAELGEDIVFAWTHIDGDETRVKTLAYSKSALVGAPSTVRDADAGELVLAGDLPNHIISD